VSADRVVRFSFSGLPIRGQWVRLEQVLVDAGAHQQYPPAVRGLLAEALAAVVLMADGIKFDGAVALQSRGDGPVGTLLAECRQRHLLRGVAHWQKTAELEGSDARLPELLGAGQLAITLTPDQDRHPGARAQQGLVALSAGTMAANLDAYFETSEQLPTRFYLAATDTQVTGLLLQRLPVDPQTGEQHREAHGEAWQRAWEEVDVLSRTLTAAELGALEPAALLRRLFAEQTLTLQPPRALRYACTCNRDKTAWTLKALPRDELLEILADDGEVLVTCEVCGRVYRYDAVDTHALLEPEEPRLH